MHQTSSIIETLINAGIRPSAQRIAIMKYLMGSHMHPTVDDIYNALSPEYPTLSRTTVYNTLKLFIDSDMVVTIDMEGHHARFDYIEYPHAHFLCRQCNRIFDIPYSETTEIPEPSNGFIIDSLSINYKGLCPQCAGKANTINRNSNTNLIINS